MFRATNPGVKIGRNCKLIFSLPERNTIYWDELSEQGVYELLENISKLEKKLSDVGRLIGSYEFRTNFKADFGSKKYRSRRGRRKSR